MLRERGSPQRQPSRLHGSHTSSPLFVGDRRVSPLLCGQRVRGGYRARTASTTAPCGRRTSKPSASARNPDRDRSRGVCGRHCPPPDPPVAPPAEQRRGLQRPPVRGLEVNTLAVLHAANLGRGCRRHLASLAADNETLAEVEEAPADEHPIRRALDRCLPTATSSLTIRFLACTTSARVPVI